VRRASVSKNRGVVAFESLSPCQSHHMINAREGVWPLGAGRWYFEALNSGFLTGYSPQSFVYRKTEHGQQSTRFSLSSKAAFRVSKGRSGPTPPRSHAHTVMCFILAALDRSVRLRFVDILIAAAWQLYFVGLRLIRARPLLKSAADLLNICELRAIPQT